MPTQDPQTANLSAQEMYDLIMGQIEPELTTDMLPELDDMYIDETDEQRAARGEWYAIAFDIFEEQYAKFVDGWKNHYTTLRNKALALKRGAQEKGGSDTNAIEDSINQS